MNAWNNLKTDIRNAKSISVFKKLLLSKKMEILYFFVYDPLGEKLLTRLRLNFADTVNPMCAWGADVETSENFLLRCHFYSSQRSELLDNPKKATKVDFKNLSD